MRLKFVPPQLPTLHDRPPEGDAWSHEVKFDGYRSQIVIDDAGTRIYTRRGLDWTSKYRDLAAYMRREALKAFAGHRDRRDHREWSSADLDR
jgi:bifunctional non-homologous end joining protein LigD